MNSTLKLSAALIGACGLFGCGEATGRRLGGEVTGGPAPLLRVGSCSAQADLELIEDMEDRNQAILQAAGRSGSWFSFNDGSPASMQTPMAGIQLFPMTLLDEPRGKSLRAVHTLGSGFAIWGAGIGFELASSAAYDASSYAGIAFWARGAEGLAQAVRINVTDRNTSQFGPVCDLDCAPNFGPKEVTDGVCMPASGPCHDYFGVDFGSELSSDWKLFSYRWDELRARNWSNKNLPTIVASEVYGLRIQADSPGPFDFWIDDIAFLCP